MVRGYKPLTRTFKEQPGARHFNKKALLPAVGETNLPPAVKNTAEGEVLTTRPLKTPKEGWRIVKGETLDNLNFTDGLTVLWTQVHAQSQPRNWSVEAPASLASRSPRAIHEEHWSKVDGGNTDFRAGFYGEHPQLQVHLQGPRGHLHVGGNIPENASANLWVAFKPHQGNEITFLRDATNTRWLIDGVSVSPAQAQVHINKIGGFELHPDAHRADQFLKALSRLDPEPMFQTLIRDPKVLSNQNTKTSEPPTTVAPTAAAPVINMGSSEVRAMPDGSFLVKTQPNYGDVLRTISNGKMLKGVLITPNGNGTSTVKVNQPSPSVVGKGMSYIGLVM
ncbi:MAG: hypothetical protein K1X64_04780 [Myxococcaceae bacterium]|nr:hypothetical protein [Myxococcaceae bacterium]